MQDFLDQFNPVFAGAIAGMLVLIVIALTITAWIPFVVMCYEMMKEYICSIIEMVHDIIE